MQEMQTLEGYDEAVFALLDTMPWKLKEYWILQLSSQKWERIPIEKRLSGITPVQLVDVLSETQRRQLREVLRAHGL